MAGEGESGTQGGEGTANAGGAPSSWLDLVPETYEGKGADGKPAPIPLRGDKALADFKDVGGLARAYIDTKRMVGAKLDGMVKVPGKDAKPEDVAAWRKATGVPESATGYKLDLPEVAGNPDWSPKAGENFAKMFHAAGISQDAGQKLVGMYAEYRAQELQALDEEYRTGLDAIRDKWGEQTYKRRAELSNRLISKVWGPEFAEYLKTSRLGNAPWFFEGMAKLADDLAEDSYIDGQIEGGLDKEEMTKQIWDKRKELATVGMGSKRGQELVKQIEDLYKARDGHETVGPVGAR